MALVKQADLARELGCEPSTVSRAIARHSLPVVDGKVDRDLFLAVFHLRNRQRASGRGRKKSETASGGGGERGAVDGEDWFKRREKAEAQLAELKLRQLAGELVDRAELAKKLGDRLAAVVVMIDALPDQFAAAFGVSDEQRGKIRRDVRASLDQVRRLLAGLAA